MTAIIGRLVQSAKLELILDEMVLVAKSDGCALVSMRRLEGSTDRYLMVSV
jgi:hypothetical protein